MKNKKNTLSLIFLIGFVVLFLSGCVSYDAAGNPSGWVYDYLGKPTIWILDWLASLFGNSYGMAVIIVTIITRIFMIPSQLKMSRSGMINAAKMEFAQPEIQEIQEEMKLSKSPGEQAILQQELQSVYKKYDINMFGDTLGGCLPMLLQMPIFAAVYAAIRSSERIASSSFLGINLGERSIIIVILVVIIYFIQGWLMKQTTPQSSNPQAQQTSSMMMWMNPIMFAWISWASAAGLGLYFLAGGVFALIQQLYTIKVVKPKIQKEIDELKEAYAKFPRQKRKSKVQPTIKEDSGRLVPTKQSLNSSGKSRRNAGKQRR